MYQGNWKCSACGGAITELPFEPRSEAGLTCRECWKKQKDANTQAAAPADTHAAEVPHDIPDDAVPAGEPPAEDAFAGMDTVPVVSGEKPKFTGDWSCAICGAAIASLPFTPRSTENLKCLECFKNSKS